MIILILVTSLIAFLFGYMASDLRHYEGLYYVYNRNKDKPKYYHTTLQSALNEAERISKKEPNDEIEVLEVLETFNKSDIPF